MDSANKPLKPDFKPLNWLTLICSFQLIAWTLGPWLSRNTLHSDTLEGIAWGNLWQWGYDKHPPLAAWSAAAFANLSDTTDFPVYLLAQLCVVAAFIAVWRLAREYLDTYGAVLAVFLLQGVLFYSNRVERVTPDTLQHALWAWLALTVYFAVTKQSMKYWLVSGVLAGLSILTKYQVVVLFAPLAMALLLTDQGRQSLLSKGPWIGGLLALLIAAPHFYWLYENKFAAFQYLESNYIDSPRYGTGTAIDHFTMPLQFLQSSIGNTLILFLLMIPLFRASRHFNHHTDFQRVFLLAIATGPMLFSLIFGLFTGEKIVPRWATPYFAWLPLLLLVWKKPQIDFPLFKKVAIWCLMTGVILLVLRCSYLVFKPKFDDKYWRDVEFTPLREQMLKAESLWAQHSQTPMPYLGGLHYHVAEMIAYSRYDTIPFLGLNPSESLWMKEEDFRKKGGMIVITHKKRNTEEVRNRLEQNYPDAVYLGTFKFKPRTKIKVENNPEHMQTLDYFLLKPEE